MSHLSTHVLDTTNGWPAAGVAVTVTDADGVLVASGRTDADGRQHPSSGGHQLTGVIPRGAGVQHVGLVRTIVETRDRVSGSR